MQPHRFSDGKSASSKAANNSAPSMTDKRNVEKKKLQKEIQQLRRIIEKAEWTLEMSRFKDVKCEIKPRDSRILHFSGITNVEAQLQNDLYKFAGFHCVKFRRGETIFNFTSANEQQKDNTYAVQIFVKNEKGSLGKWVMPMSVDMNEMLDKIPMNELKHVTPFLKNCKHNIDCYTIRQEQFLSLKEHILHMKHYMLHSNVGYTQTNLELYGVHDRENDTYIDLIIYLLYHPDEARPYKIKVDTTTKNKLSDETSQRLKAYLKEFKISNLQTAFDKIFMKKNSAFIWTRMMDDDESPLEMSNTSISEEEGFLEQLQSKRKKSLRRAKRKRELRDKWNKRKKQKVTTNIASSENNSDDDDDDAHSKAEVSYTKNPHQTPINEKKTEKITSSSKQQKQNGKNRLEVTPMNKSKIKLKQTKLHFQDTQSTNSDNVNKDTLLQLKSYKLSNKNQKISQLVTSTPLHHHVNNKLISTLEIDNITEIGSPPKKVADNMNDLKNSSRSENESPRKKIQVIKKKP